MTLPVVALLNIQTNINYYCVELNTRKVVISGTKMKRIRVRVRKIYFDNEKHDIEETNTETFM